MSVWTRHGITEMPVGHHETDLSRRALMSKSHDGVNFRPRHTKSCWPILDSVVGPLQPQRFKHLLCIVKRSGTVWWVRFEKPERGPRFFSIFDNSGKNNG